MKTNSSHLSSTELSEYLEKKSDLSSKEIEYYKNHLNHCRSCWNVWNKVRWDKTKGTQGLLELRSFLGDQFLEYFDSSWAIAEDWNAQNPKTPQQITDFYKNCSHYLYNLIIWDESGDRGDFTTEFSRLAEKFEVKSLLDFGCGVGVDGLKFMDLGTKVIFVDFDNPSTKFLRWRLKQRKLSAQILNVEDLERYPAVDAFWAIDVLEHMVDPTETVRKLHQSTRLFIHRSEFSNTSGDRHPCHLPFEEVKLVEELKKHGFQNVPWNTVLVWVRD